MLECNDVQLYDYDVKVAMAETDELDEDGTPTGRKTKPKPPYKKPIYVANYNASK